MRERVLKRYVGGLAVVLCILSLVACGGGETGGRLPASESCSFRGDLSTISVGYADVYECDRGSKPPRSDPGEAYEFGCGEMSPSGLVAGSGEAGPGAGRHGPNPTYWSCL